MTEHILPDAGSDSLAGVQTTPARKFPFMVRDDAGLLGNIDSVTPLSPGGCLP